MVLTTCYEVGIRYLWTEPITSGSPLVHDRSKEFQYYAVRSKEDAGLTQLLEMTKPVVAEADLNQV